MRDPSLDETLKKSQTTSRLVSLQKGHAIASFRRLHIARTWGSAGSTFQAAVPIASSPLSY
jgi:hypothetical protein